MGGKGGGGSHQTEIMTSDNGDVVGVFEEGCDVPRDVTRVSVHPTIRAIVDSAFHGCSDLSVVTLGKGLEENGEGAFVKCTLLREILIPHSVKTIRDYAFGKCSQLTTVILGEGLEEIGQGGFYECTSLREIQIPHAVMMIKDSTFSRCSHLTTAILGEGLEEIEVAAFAECTQLHEILIPRTVKTIKDRVLQHSSQLTRGFLGRGWRRSGWGHLVNARRFVRFLSPILSRRLKIEHSVDART